MDKLVNNKKNIALIGFMGCGKSTVGKELAHRLGYVLMDTDKAVEKKWRMPVSEIFKVYGEEGFRERESAALKAILESKRKMVISTGGGLTKNQRNVAMLKENAWIIFLDASVEKLYDNTRRSSNRPLLDCDDPKERIRQLLGERLPLYRQCADLTVHTDKLTVKGCAEEIIRLLKNENYS